MDYKCSVRLCDRENAKVIHNIPFSLNGKEEMGYRKVCRSCERILVENFYSWEKKKDDSGKLSAV